MEQDLAHKRPFLFASLAFGLSYPISAFINMPDLAIMLWKMASVSCLAFYALRHHSHGYFAVLACFLVFYALGDALVQFNLFLGGISFAIGHLIAIYLYSRYRRASLNPSQIALAIAIVIIVPLLAWMIAKAAASEDAIHALIYALLLAIMAAMAWTSVFPRYRTGLGAILFIISDLLLLFREGLSADIIWLNLLVWYNYYFGVFLITTGIVQTMRKREA